MKVLFEASTRGHSCKFQQNEGSDGGASTPEMLDDLLYPRGGAVMDLGEQARGIDVILRVKPSCFRFT